MRRRTLLQGGAGALLLAGCTKQPPPPRPPPREVPRLHLEPLSDLLPAGGLDSLVQVRWAEVLRTLGAQLYPLLPPPKLDLLSEYLGFELRLIEELWIASYGSTTLYLMRVPHDPEKVERIFRERLTSDQKRSADGPGAVRMTGRIGTTPRGIATLLPDVLAFEIGTTGPLLATVAFAQEKLKKSKPALVVEPLLEADQKLEDAPIQAFFPSPTTSWQGAHGLLERATAAAFSLKIQEKNLVLKAILLGAWDDPPTEALHRLDLTVKDLSNSTLGKLIGLNESVNAYRTIGNADMLTVEGTLSIELLVRGLHDITQASLSELFPGLKQ